VDGFELRYGSAPGSLNTVVDVGRPRQTGAQFSYELDVPADQPIYICVAAIRGQEISDCSDQLTVAPSNVDERLENAAPGEVQRTWCEDFNTGMQSSSWHATGPDFSLSEESGRFAVQEIGNDSYGLRTSSNDDNIHSHFLGSDLHGTGASTWSGYEYSGQMTFSDASSGVGVTIYSRYVSDKNYYRLGRHPGANAFHLERDRLAFGGYKCISEPGAQAPTALPGTWYTFRLRARDLGSEGTELKGKVWPVDEAEPDAFQWVCVDPSTDRQTSGAIGVWAAGSGSKGWDSLNVSVVPPDSTGALPGQPGKPGLAPRTN
jgi:hypothetical protein